VFASCFGSQMVSRTSGGVRVNHACPRAIANDTTIMHANAKLRFMSCSS
jgi:hypothetical protein